MRETSCTAIVFSHAARDVHCVREHVWLAARRVLSEMRGTPIDQTDFARTEHGKPMLSPSSRLWFNLSHGAHASLLAVSRIGDVGCDIEDRLRADDVKRIGPLVLHPSELQYLESQSLSERRAAFARCWTRKEAALKARGFGFALDARSVDTGLGRFRPSVRFGDELVFILHDAPAAIGLPAAVACVDSACEWQSADLAAASA